MLTLMCHKKIRVIFAALILALLLLGQSALARQGHRRAKPQNSSDSKSQQTAAAPSEPGQSKCYISFANQPFSKHTTCCDSFAVG